MGEIPLFDKCSPYANAATIFRAKWRRWGACVRVIAISRRNRCCSRRRAYSSAPSRLVQPAAGPRATCWPHGAAQAARDNRAKSRAMSASPPARSATEEKAAYVPAVVIDGVDPNSRIDIQDCVRMCLVEGAHFGDRDMVLPEEIHGLYARRSPRSSIEI